MNTNLRSTMTAGSRRVRAYFAPVDRVTATPADFNLARDGQFVLESPPPGWFDAGWIDAFARSAGTRTETLRGGPKGAPVAQFRSNLDARVEFVFRDWGKLQMALAGGSQHLNLLALDLEADPLGRTLSPPIPVLGGSSASQLFVDPAALGRFKPGDIVAVDRDYQDDTGYVGAGIAAAYVADPALILGDQNYIRRVTFNVARVATITTNSLQLAAPLLAGDPPEGVRVQKLVGFADREGGSFFQEWSALFVIAEELGGRVCFYYPRLQTAASAADTSIEVAGALHAYGLHAAFTALPVTDPNDAEKVLCYRAYFPAKSAAIY